MEIRKAISVRHYRLSRRGGERLPHFSLDRNAIVCGHTRGDRRRLHVCHGWFGCAHPCTFAVCGRLHLARGARCRRLARAGHPFAARASRCRGSCAERHPRALASRKPGHPFRAARGSTGNHGRARARRTTRARNTLRVAVRSATRGPRPAVRPASRGERHHRGHRHGCRPDCAGSRGEITAYVQSPRVHFGRSRRQRTRNLRLVARRRFRDERRRNRRLRRRREVDGREGEPLRRDVE